MQRQRVVKEEHTQLLGDTLAEIAAEKAGIRPGDIIVGLEGNAVTTMSQLKELLSYYAAGEEVTLIVYQVDGNEYVQKEIRVTLGDSSTIEQ